MIDTIIEDDCLEAMPGIPDKSIDMILCDLPYGTIKGNGVSLGWDSIIPFEPLWHEYRRIIRDNGAIVLTSSQPFTTRLISSCFELYKYSWIWIKSNGVGHLNAKNAPIKMHEDILVFSKGDTANLCKNPMKYFPQGLTPCKIIKKNRDESHGSQGNRPSRKGEYIQTYNNYPTSILHFPNDRDKAHPTQKPVALFEYLIKTYTNEGDAVLDNCAGSGTTGVAAINTNRHYILIEKEPKYVAIAKARIASIPARLDRWL
ncbi:MAG: site-specific DNA-methyltransferase [Desulfoplanes sp.]